MPFFYEPQTADEIAPNISWARWDKKRNPAAIAIASPTKRITLVLVITAHLRKEAICKPRAKAVF